MEKRRPDTLAVPEPAMASPEEAGLDTADAAPLGAGALPARLLFFDGECVLCNGVVNLLLRIDRQRRFRYASLQGTTAEQLRRVFPEFPEALDTFVYVEGDRILLRSRAVIAVAAELP